jgi:periplasmic mercuric ion binding protein
MKSIKLIMLAVVALISTSLFAQTKTDTIKVWGNCGMCENRIEKALKMEGVTRATWDSDTQLLVVTYDANKTSNDAIQKKVASVGHDTDKYMADDKAYNKLPGCCKYDRKEKSKG